MHRDTRIEGSSVVINFGEYQARLRGRPPVVPTAANDDNPREPVKTVTVRRTLEKSGVSVKIKVPVDEFIGVAVSTHISEEGVLSSAISLVHTNPDLNYQVFEEAGNHSVVAEWQNWGKKLRLPLYIMAGASSPPTAIAARAFSIAANPARPPDVWRQPVSGRQSIPYLQGEMSGSAACRSGPRTFFAIGRNQREGTPFFAGLVAADRAPNLPRPCPTRPPDASTQGRPSPWGRP